MGALRDFNLKDFNCEVYVETGTGQGVTLAKAYKDFEKVYSVDVDPVMVSKALAMFANASIIRDYSTVALEKWLREDLVNVDCVLFFLDAHFPGSDFYGAKYDVHAPHAVPLKEELELIKKYRPDSKDVIICDDARIYAIGPFEHGNCLDVQVPGGHRFVYDIFPLAKIDLNFSEEGYIIIDRR